MILETQTNSRSRLKNDTLGNITLTELYNAYSIESDAEFEQTCINIVQSGGGHQTRKSEIIAGIVSAKTKEKKLKKAQDFILAGMGLGV